MTESTVTTQTEVIDLEDLAHVREVVDKANRKAVKIGVPGYVIHEGARSVREVKVPDPFNIGSWKVVGHIEQVEVSVLGEAPKYAGWTFVATIDWVNDDAVIRKVRGLEDVDTNPARAALVPNGCDHCNAARSRNATYLLRHEDGTFKQVGSTCLREFLGVEVNLSLLGFNPYEGCDSTNRYVPDTFGTLHVLEDTLAIIRYFGWVSGGQAYNDSTKTATRERLTTAYSRESDTYKGRETAAGEARRAIRENRREDDAERAAAIIAWIRSDAIGNTEYAQNLKAAVGSAPQTRTFTTNETGEWTTYTREVEEFQFRHLGLVISAVEGYRRFEEKAAARKVEHASSLNEWVGVEKERLRALRLTVVSTRWIESDFGSSLLVIFRDEPGHTFKWFASNAPEALETTGATVVLDGTVKKHETYNERKSTVLTRCAVKEVVTS